MSQGTGSIQDCHVLLKTRARCALVQCVQSPPPGPVTWIHARPGKTGPLMPLLRRKRGGFASSPLWRWGVTLQPPSQHSSFLSPHLTRPSTRSGLPSAPGVFSASGPLLTHGLSWCPYPQHVLPHALFSGARHGVMGGCCGHRTGLGEPVQTPGVSSAPGQGHRDGLALQLRKQL